MKKHPNKHIREVIEYAYWDVVETGTSGHAFCRLKCVLGHSEHQMSVWSTPKNPENHAKQIKAKIKHCSGDEL